MNKVTTVHLNGKAFQLEEAGYDALRAYLTQAESTLEGNPDKAEVIGDLESAIGEKCSQRLNPHKDIVTTAEIEEILKQMGPVNGAQEDTAPHASAKATGPKRLYLIREGAVLAGVCMGLASYFDIDVTIVRIVFVALTIFTGGAWIAAYIAMALLIPYAVTGEEKAAARGESFKAQDIVDRAKERFQESYERFTGKHASHLHWKMEKKRMKMQWKQEQMRMRYGNRHFSAGAHVAGVVSALLGVLWVLALVSLVSTGALFGYAIPAGLPLWGAIILLFIAYHAVTGPIRGAKYAYRSGSHGEYYGGYDMWEGVAGGLTFVFLLIAALWAYSAYPQVHSFVNNLPQEIPQWWHSVRGK